MNDEIQRIVRVSELFESNNSVETETEETESTDHSMTNDLICEVSSQGGQLKKVVKLQKKIRRVQKENTASIRSINIQIARNATMLSNLQTRIRNARSYFDSGIRDIRGVLALMDRRHNDLDRLVYEQLDSELEV